uniref:Putative LOV domain-containing protein n=1 Tax=Radula lindenbergiana TaxID=697108 RepID=A0A126WW41_9MARC|nr:putative LOV domain-containing protein [Radula lindenbergiana]
MGKPCVGAQLEDAATRARPRDSLEALGHTAILQETHSVVQGSDRPLLSRAAPRSACNGASRVVESLVHEIPPSDGPLRGTSAVGNGGGAQEVTRRTSAARTRSQDRVEISLDELIVELEAAEEEVKMHSEDGDRRYSTGAEDDHRYSDVSFDQGYYDGRAHRGSSESSGGVSSGVSEEVISERAAQWGYGVVLKNSRESTPRSSAGSFTGASRGASGGAAAQQTIPSVSLDVKDALASFQLAFLVCDATDSEFPILYASAGFSTMTGYTADEIMGKNCRFLQGVDTDRLEIGKVRQALKAGGTYTGTVLNYKKDGTPFWNLLTLSPIKDDAGKVIKYIGMQAEQNSKEPRPRNSKGQKSPAIRAIPGFIASALDAPRRHSANGVLRPPVPPPAASPNGERYLGSLIGEQTPRRPSQRYSLSSNPARGARNSSVAIDGSSREPDWREAALRLREHAAAAGASSEDSSPRVASNNALLSSDHQRSKSGRLTTRLRRIFSRKDSKESKRRSRSESVKSEKINAEEFSDSEEDVDDDSSGSGSVRNSGSRRRPSAMYAPSSTSGSLLRPESSVDELCQRLQMQFTEGELPRQQQAPPPPPFDGNKRQFCIVHS